MLEWVQAYRWDTTRFASRLQGWLGPGVSPRKARLYAAAVGRAVGDLLARPTLGEDVADAVIRLAGAGERLADGAATQDECDQALGSVLAVWNPAPPPPRDALPRPAWRTVEELLEAFWRGRVYPGWFSDVANETRVVLLRDIFGNPFRPVPFDSLWRTSDAAELARQMYENRDFTGMPVLADALQEAGCGNDDILNHCSGAGQHVRGCWVVDLVLGKA